MKGYDALVDFIGDGRSVVVCLRHCNARLMYSKSWLQGGAAAMRAYKKRRRRMPGSLPLCVALLVGFVAGQGTRPTNVNPPLTSTSASPSNLDATSQPVSLVESVPVQATLNAQSTSPARFYLAQPFANASNPLYVSVSLCSGPAVPSYNSTDPAVLSQLGLSSYEASIATLLRMYVSTNQDNPLPGPESLSGNPDIQYLQGGFARDQTVASNADGAWITIWPPSDVRNASGSWVFDIVASTQGSPAALVAENVLTYEDSDYRSALLSTSQSYAGIQPNMTLYVLPTTGQGSMPDSEYFNSSICAIASSFAAFNASSNNDQPNITASETQRGIFGLTIGDARKTQWEVSNLDRATNFTAWLVEYGQLGSTSNANLSIFPAVKFVTKRNSNCRLVYDVDFCPQVGYSIPISPNVETSRALSIINATVGPNFSNFSITIDTFPCNSTQFGQYSSVHGCQDCKSRYHDWLCSVTMPRCVDTLSAEVDGRNNSAAVIDPLTLNGQQTETSGDSLPYILNRNGNSRQSYIDDSQGLDAGSYGELLPCIYNCYFVSRSCPIPLVQWTCPVWDISAQSDYGTFADDGVNAGAGQDGQRWGGPSRYIAQDAFGNLYCNSMGTDILLRQVNAGSKALPAAFQHTFLLVTAASFSSFILLILL